MLVVLILSLCITCINVFSSSNGSAGNGDATVYVTSLISVVAVVLIIFFILQSKLNKDRCPRCKMVNDFVVVRDKEVSHDTKTVTKKIQKKIRSTDGQILKTTEEIGQVVIVDSVHNQQRKCKNCYHTWDVTIKKHLEY